MSELQANILFIDDDTDLVDGIGPVLEMAGYRVRHASNGDEGLAMARQESPDLILLDLMMPVKSGFETCSELRQVGPLADVPIIALTAFGQDIGEIYGLHREDPSAGVQGFLEKPVEINVLLSRIKSLLQRGGDA